ncbi:MAG: ATP-dependent DNA helicase RecG [Candidatus Daviesbacteria bacterium]
MDLKTPLAAFTGIGPTFAKRLEKLGLFNVEDLINHYPFRYDDFSNISSVAQAQIGDVVTIKGEIWAIKNIYTRFGKVLTRATLNDGTAAIEIIWFNQSWLTKSIKVGDKIQASGKIDRKGYKTTLVSPQWEKLDSLQTSVVSHQTIHTGRLIPVYPETYGITSKWIRAKIAKLLPALLSKINDPIPDSITKSMVPLTQALQQIHYPESFEQVKLAVERLGFDELFYIQVGTQKVRADWQKKQITQAFKVDDLHLQTFIQSLPFELTSAQKKVIGEIAFDLKKDYPMNRLLQGEVGSGKTVVAASALYLAFTNGLRSILMAPTEILAFQHYQTLTNLLGKFGIKIGLYTGSRKYTKKSTTLTTRDTPDVIVGTHALLSEKLSLENVGLVVVDEQQRFGVEQRSLLRSRAKTPHFLTMTATPIPRTVALTLYGDLDLSIIDQIPVGRKVVRTHFVPDHKRADAYKFMAEHIKEGEQVYIITPLIEESETLATARAAKVEHDKLSKEVFPKLKLGLLHGRLKSKEKEEIINKFRDQKIDILVSTSVVEVGMDIPNATIMVIEGAERFGLAQLHQLRGRVGRGEKQSFALLFCESSDPGVTARVKNLEKIYDGLKLAELDLKIRGSGEIFGTRQSGDWNLKIASLTNLSLIEKSKEAAAKILAESPTLDKYPQIRAKLTSEGKSIFPD